ncbi:MAG: GNAT family N-acetyltransferase [Candidatus Lokiarchaeota archaeon]|nr:GNAT family N-acetyltransferase [Candidatus Lokiarchaeota archaeon]
MREINPVFKKIDDTFTFQNYEFGSGFKELDEFLYKYASIFMKYGYSQMYILEELNKSNIIGYFTLSSSTIQWDDSLFLEKITRYIPGILLGMFAIDKRFRRKGFGSDLIKKAVSIALSVSKVIGCRCVFVDSLTNHETIKFYLNMGFDFVDKPLGRIILKKLSSNEKIDKNTIKMYFDLFKLKKK